VSPASAKECREASDEAREERIVLWGDGGDGKDGGIEYDGDFHRSLVDYGTWYGEMMGEELDATMLEKWRRMKVEGRGEEDSTTTTTTMTCERIATGRSREGRGKRRRL
jgi:hypothetical protein